MKYKNNLKWLHTEKITKNQILIYSGEGGGGEPVQVSGCGIKTNCKPAMHLRSRQVCVRIASVLFSASCHQHHLSRNQLGQNAKESPGQKKNVLIPKTSQTKREWPSGWPDRGHDYHRLSNCSQITRTTYK
jgi:hypothetical protein